MDFLEIKRLHNLYVYEDSLYCCGYDLIAGADEVGRGSFAGPIVAAAVILQRNAPLIDGLDDSKKINGVKRLKLFKIILKSCLCWSVARLSPELIDRISLGSANVLVLKKALARLKIKPSIAITDAICVNTEKYGFESFPIINGDRLCASIAAASIIAKVIRDSIMDKYAGRYPYYAFENNKGYGTKKHIEAIKKYGFCKIHRKSFKINY
ncbi:MAG: ribonuclease HII [Actinobacteria bacterium]|nr:ribonuclease HII [Actinomycetota bacterium]